MINCQPPVVRRASDVLYDETIGSKNGGRRENIRLIKLVCDQMEKDKVTITAAEVARRSGDAGPAYSTISNKGSKLGDYIRLRITEQASTFAPSPGFGRSIADTVTDPVLQAQIRDKESAARWLTRENTGLRALLKSLRPGVDIDKVLQNPSNTRLNGLVEFIPTNSNINEDELRGMLLKLMDHLTGSRQYKEHRGRLTINSKVILETRELQLFRETTGLNVEEWRRRYGQQEATNG